MRPTHWGTIQVVMLGAIMLAIGGSCKEIPYYWLGGQLPLHEDDAEMF